MTITIGNKKLEDIINEVSRQVYGIPFSNNEDIKEDCAMTRDEQLKRLKAFVKDIINYKGCVNNRVLAQAMDKHGLLVDGVEADWLPERPFFRVALYESVDGFYTVVADDSRKEAQFEKDKLFVRWLTDRQEYEV